MQWITPNVLHDAVIQSVGQFLLQTLKKFLKKLGFCVRSAGEKCKLTISYSVRTARQLSVSYPQKQAKNQWFLILKNVVIVLERLRTKSE